MCPPRPSDNEAETGLPPGAERFWGQFSQARAGRAEIDEEPSGSQDPDGDQAANEPGHHCLEWCPICRSAELLQAATSPEVKQQIQAIQNEAIQVFKAFAALYAERTANHSPGSGTDSGQGSGNRSRPGKDDPPDDDQPKVTDISIM